MADVGFGFPEAVRIMLSMTFLSALSLQSVDILDFLVDGCYAFREACFVLVVCTGFVHYLVQLGLFSVAS